MRDPAGSGMPWFDKPESKETVNLNGMNLFDEELRNDGGRCFRFGEIDFYSPAGSHAKEFLEKSPLGTEVVVVPYSESWMGRTWSGSYMAKYFGNEIEEN